MRLLNTFRNLFDGKQYLHRKSNLGDLVAAEFYEDLLNVGKSEKVVERMAKRDRVINLRNLAIGRTARRGDGSFGELVPTATTIVEQGFRVARGPTANVEIGAETKILAKAMIKQIDRVIGDLLRQVEMFKRQGAHPICVAFVGINHAQQYISYEGDRSYETDGRKYKHPIQEAADAERRLISQARPAFDEFLILKFVATNSSPFPFQWLNEERLQLEYNALLTRVCREYDKRF
jgi:hypothetical protein